MSALPISGRQTHNKNKLLRPEIKSGSLAVCEPDQKKFPANRCGRDITEY